MESTPALPKKPVIEARVSITSFRILTVVTFILSLLIVTCRLAILVHQRKRPGWDGVLLILSTLFLIAGTTTILIYVDTLYFFEMVILNGLDSIDPSQLATLIDKLVYFQTMNWVYFTLTWSSIFFVKFAFLVFFSGLCDRLRKIEIYRKVVFGICVITFIYNILSSFVACPYLGMQQFQCDTPSSLNRMLDYGTVSITLDVLTDILILIIPITLLWKVKLRIYQKIAIGIFLCLSAIMVVLAIIRVAGVKYYDFTEITWGALWQQVESCAAVSMISLTAFRSVFISSSPRSSRENKPWKASIPHFAKRFRGSSVSSQNRRLYDISIPRATMTGMRTVIGGDVEDDGYVNPPEPAAAVGYHGRMSEKGFVF